MSAAGPARRSPVRPWEVVLVLLLFCGALWLAYHLRAILIPLLVALLLAYVWNPLVTWLEGQGVRRVWSIALIYVAFYGGVASLAIFGGPVLVHQGVTFVEEMFVGDTFDDKNADGVRNFDEPLLEDLNGNRQFDAPKVSRLIDWSEAKLRALTGSSDIIESLRKLRERAKGHEGEIAKALAQTSRTLVSWLTASVEGFLATISFLVLVPVYMFFLLKNMNRLWEGAQKLIPGPHRERIVATLRRIHRANAAFFRGQATISLIEGTILFIALWALGVPFSLLFGALYAVAAMVPFVGPTVGFVVTAIFVFVDKGGFSSTFFAVVGIFAAIQVLESLALQPFILGKETGLHPVVIILSIFIFGELFGFFGILLAIPLASATIILCQDYVMPLVRRVAEESEPST